MSRTTKQKPAVVEVQPDIWSILVQQTKFNNHNNNNNTPSRPAQSDSTIFVCGDMNSGKTTLLYYLLGITADIRSTTGIAYKRTNRLNKDSTESYTYCYELGDGYIYLQQLIKIPITVDSIINTYIIINIDLAQYNTAVQSCHKYILSIQQHCMTIKQSDHKLYEQLINNKLARFRYDTKHVDYARIRDTLLPVPIIINCSKYDILQQQPNITPDQLKYLSLALRALSLTYGCTLLYTQPKHSTSDSIDPLLPIKQLIKLHTLQYYDKLVKLTQNVDSISNKPITVLCNTDSIQSIGTAPIIHTNQPSTNWCDNWCNYYNSTYNKLLNELPDYNEQSKLLSFLHKSVQQKDSFELKLDAQIASYQQKLATDKQQYQFNQKFNSIVY